MKLFSYRNRPVHMGPYPAEKLARLDDPSNISYAGLAPQTQLDLAPDDDPTSILHAMDDYLSLIDTLRDGPTNPQEAEIPDCPIERANNLKAAGYFIDTTLAGTCELNEDLWLPEPFAHPRISEWAEKSRASIDKPLPPAAEMAFRRIAMAQPAAQKSVEHHTHAIAYAIEYPRDPGSDEAGAEWIQGSTGAGVALLEINLP